MKYVEKYVLIPYEEYKNHMEKDNTVQTPVNTVGGITTPLIPTDTTLTTDPVPQDTPSDAEINYDSFDVENFITYLSKCGTDTPQGDVVPSNNTVLTIPQDPGHTTPMNPTNQKKKRPWISI